MNMRYFWRGEKYWSDKYYSMELLFSINLPGVVSQGSMFSPGVVFMILIHTLSKKIMYAMV